ncbi:hypothetical protein MPSEU_000188000 [Mayamaea pseudoterrestris]|nr:hypothetical protein MPSEU_000188000 [Mayamaea pseudoterrestris]
MMRRQRLLCTLFTTATALVTVLSLEMTSRSLVRISESVWRASATQHSHRIRELLQPGLLLPAETTRQQRRPSSEHESNDWTALDPKHPTYNFLIEYYGLKGGKGPRRLARWSPDFGTLLAAHTIMRQEDGNDINTGQQYIGILLEGANQDDLGSTLHLRGAVSHSDGIVYSPRQFYSTYTMEDATRAATAFVWYRSILEATLKAEPVLHCYGLHEWAMQYWPDDGIAQQPPSAKYQSHLPLRVNRTTINETVERKGVSCTHVDALRFFAPAAAPLNHHGQALQRVDQLKLEQPACVHAHMDLLKIALKLQPFCDSVLLQRVLQGRAEYKRRQLQLMQETRPVREDLLQAYQTFMSCAFDESVLTLAEQSPMAERFAVAAPGSEPWRRNLAI